MKQVSLKNMNLLNISLYQKKKHYLELFDHSFSIQNPTNSFEKSQRRLFRPLKNERSTGWIDEPNSPVTYLTVCVISSGAIPRSILLQVLKKWLPNRLFILALNSELLIFSVLKFCFQLPLTTSLQKGTIIVRHFLLTKCSSLKKMHYSFNTVYNKWKN